MKRIVIPADIHGMSFSQFVLDNVTLDAAFGTSLGELYIGMRLREGFEAETSLKPGDTWELSDGDYELLLRVVCKPSTPYVPSVAYKLKAFFDAILNVES